MNKYLKIWLKNTALSLQSDLTTRGSTLFFILGKISRFYFFLIFIFIILGKTGHIMTYSTDQVFIFYLIFNLFDILGQFLFRGIYWFRARIISGDFDLTLTKPISPLFLVMTDKTDFLDFPLLLIVLYLLVEQIMSYSVVNILIFIGLGLCGLIIVTAIHIFIASLGILTTEVNNIIWIYRDLSAMAKFPIDIYNLWIRSFLIFIIPIGIIFTFPAKALLGMISWQSVVYSVILSIGLLILSLKVWQASLKKYSSASS